MSFHSTKTYGHEVGLSCCFRQWRAKHSHCSKLHGYAIAVTLTFACTYLDETNWVMDFGGLKEVKKWLQDNFDHKLIISRDDPAANQILALETAGVADVVVINNVGCEAFARHIGLFVQEWLNDHPTNVDSKRVWLYSCEVREHGANSAIWIHG